MFQVVLISPIGTIMAYGPTFQDFDRAELEAKYRNRERRLYDDDAEWVVIDIF